jgi:hypothetical protein
VWVTFLYRTFFRCDSVKAKWRTQFPMLLPERVDVVSDIEHDPLLQGLAEAEFQMSTPSCEDGHPRIPVVSTPYVVRPGDCLCSIAARYGFASYEDIYNAPQNAEFKKKRPNPNVIYPGDVVMIPKIPLRTYMLATGTRHRIVVQVPKVVLRIDVPVSEPHFYEVVVGKSKKTGRTDEGMPIELRVPVGATGGSIDLWPAKEGNENAKEDVLTWELLIGHLDPIDEISGVQGRLANLGYYNDPVDGHPSSSLTLAIAQFEDDNDLEVTGDPQSHAMQDKLAEFHDGSSD